MNHYKTMLAAATTGLLAASAQSAVIYNEASDGDLGFNNPALPSGLGTVLGQINPGTDGSDSMSFNGLTPDTQINFSVDTTFTDYAGGYYININRSSASGGGNLALKSYFGSDATGTKNDGFILTVPSDGIINVNISSEAGPASQANYKISAGPDAIPEPSSSALLGLSALALAARRKRQA